MSKHYVLDPKSLVVSLPDDVDPGEFGLYEPRTIPGTIPENSVIGFGSRVTDLDGAWVGNFQLSVVEDPNGLFIYIDLT